MNKTYEKKCIENCNILVNNAFETNQSFCVLRQLLEMQSSDIDILNISPAFYQSVIRNCIQNMFIETVKMYDSNSQTLGIKSFIDNIYNNINQLDNKRSIKVSIFSDLEDLFAEEKEFNNLTEMIEWALEEIKKNESLFNSVKAQRDKYYAHLERRITNNIEGFFNKNKITYENIKHLLLLNTNLCNLFYTYFCKKVMIPLASNHDDFKKTVNLIKGYKANKGCYYD